MKKTLFLFGLLIFLGKIEADCQYLRYYPFKSAESKGVEPGFATKDSSIYFSPCISIDLFIREAKTGAYKIGAIPGVGYGIKYKPKYMKNGYLISLDFFAQANLNEEIELHEGFDYFNIDFLPVFSVFNWIGIGYGIRYKVGLYGVPSSKCGIFSFGIKKTL